VGMAVGLFAGLIALVSAVGALLGIGTATAANKMKE